MNKFKRNTVKLSKTKRERYPRKTKKRILKYYTRSAYSEVVHLKERYIVGFDIASGIDSSVICIGYLPIELVGTLIEAEANHYKRLYNTPCAEVDAIVSNLKELVKNHPRNMSREEEIAYILGDSDVSALLVESVNRCVDCDGFCECSLGQFPAEETDKACRFFSNESTGNE